MKGIILHLFEFQSIESGFVYNHSIMMFDTFESLVTEDWCAKRASQQAGRHNEEVSTVPGR